MCTHKLILNCIRNYAIIMYYQQLCIQFSNLVHISHCTDIPTPVGVRAEASADNTSIMVSWEWSRQDVPMCVGLVRVNYQPEGGSLMNYTVGSTTAMTNATLPNLQCNTEYIILIYVAGGQTERMSIPRMVYLPARGVQNLFSQFTHFHCDVTLSHPQPLPLPLRSVFMS